MLFSLITVSRLMITLKKEIRKIGEWSHLVQNLVHWRVIVNTMTDEEFCLLGYKAV
jgi:hypothetical protein